MLYEIAESILKDISTFSVEARSFLEEERYRGYIPVENVNPSNVVVDTIPIVIDELADYGILTRTNPATIAENGSVIVGFYRCARYLLPNGIQSLIRNDRMLLSLYEEIAGQYSTSPSNIVTDLLMALGAGPDPYVPALRDACIDVLDNIDFYGTSQYADTITNMCNIVRTAQASDYTEYLDYVTTVHSFYGALQTYMEKVLSSDSTPPDARDVFGIRLRQIASILTSPDVMEHYAGYMFGGAPNKLNLTVPVLSLSPLIPSYWTSKGLPIGGSNAVDEFLCKHLVLFTQQEITNA